MGVTPIGIQGVTPEVIAQSLVEEAKNLKAVFIVGFGADGLVHEYITGDIAELALAGAILTDHAMTIVRR